MSRPSSPWIAGFEGDRWVVLTRLGPWWRVSPKPYDFHRKPFQQLHELRIEDWSLKLTPPPLGPLLEIDARLEIRFQATLNFARRHADHLGDLAAHVRHLFQPLIKDAAEELLRHLESAQWLKDGCAELEHEIETLVQELLALKDIQSRCLCRIDARVNPIDPVQLDQDLASTDPGRNLVALSLLRQQRESQERIAREQHRHQLLEQRLKLEQQSEQLELLRQETALMRALEAEATRKTQEQILAEEQRKSELLKSESRLAQERLKLETEIRALEMKASLEEKNQRELSHPEVQAHLQREIELLAMERQRLALEEEIQKTKKSRAQGWFSGLRNTPEDAAE